LIGADGHVYVFGDAHDRGAARGALIATGIAHN
jgi:hypothetical protein